MLPLLPSIKENLQPERTDLGAAAMCDERDIVEPERGVT